MLNEEIFYIFYSGILTERADMRIMRKRKNITYMEVDFRARDNPGSREYIRQIQSGRMI